MRVLSMGTYLQVVVLAWGLAACTDRNLQMDFLSKNIVASYQFEVTNAESNKSDILPNNTDSTMPFQVECSKSVVSIEIMDPQTQEWKDVKEVDANAQVNCADSKSASFALPLSFVGAPTNPGQPGDNRQGVQVRLSVKNITGEINQYTKSYAAFFPAPALTVVAPDINAASTYGGASTQYPVSGTCSQNSGTVQISAPFAATVNATCTGGTYSANLAVTTAVTDGSPKITVRHNPPAPVRAFNQTEKTIRVDRTAPALTMTSPASSASFNKASAPNDKITVSGACETGLPVNITVQGVSGTTTAACASGAYSTQINVIQGTMRVTAVQTDAAANVTTVSASGISVDTIPPAAATIAGLGSVNVGDTVFDNKLLEVGPNISFTPVSDGASYNVAILQGSTVLCQSTAAGPLSVTTQVGFASCLLGNNTSYKARVIVSDAAGNSTETNYSFNTEFPIPTITSVATTGITAGVAPKSSVIVYNITFNRNITISGSPTISLNVKTGGKAIAFTSLVNSKTLTFTYTVDDGENANPIAFASNAFGGSFTIRDAATSEMINSPTIPTALYTNVIRVDTTPPSPVTGFSLGAVPAYYNKTPNISYTVPSDQDTLTVQVSLKSGSTVVAQSSAHTSGQGLAVSGAGLEKGATYTVEVVTMDAAGNKSTAMTGTYQSFACPENYLYVYNANINPSPFCVAPIEARNTTGNAMFADSAFSVGPQSYTYNQSLARCQNIGTKYDLPTTAEWNAIADLIVQRGDNWVQGIASGTTASANYVFTGYAGNSGTGTASAINTSSPCSPGTTSNCGTGNPYRRKLYLPSIGTAAAQEIWDFSGNMYEFTKDPDYTAYSTINNIIPSLPTGAGTLRGAYGTAMACNGNSVSNTPFCGFGSLNFWCSETVGMACSVHSSVITTNAYIVRGGSINSYSASAYTGSNIDNAGVFAAFRGVEADQGYANTGFRCVYHP